MLISEFSETDGQSRRIMIMTALHHICLGKPVYISSYAGCYLHSAAFQPICSMFAGAIPQPPFQRGGGSRDLERYSIAGRQDPSAKADKVSV
jgi:hypothetical protein